MRVRSGSTILTLGGAIAMGCAPANAPRAAGDAPPPPATAAWTDATSPRPADRSQLLFTTPESVRQVIPVRYERGTKETVLWEGTGPGVAMLTNGYGQMVYRVEEGGEPFRGLIPPGDYVLTLTNATPRDGQVLTAPIAVRGLALERQLLSGAHPGHGVTRGGKGSRPPRGAANGDRVPA